MTTGPDLMFAREPLPAPASRAPSVFLAGPSPRAANPVPSWRPAAIAALAERWTRAMPLTVLNPESRDGTPPADYDDQVDWETRARAATAILFWIPRDVKTLPGFTTNVEFGLDVTTGKVVLGCPPDCPNPERNRYLIHVARRHGVPVRDTLADTVAAAPSLITATK
ncbi:nucleoside 2-deoxyribosyltransferase domain-containing protein [Streptomyces xanthophaeus]|uniref:nucleoside 2-deoxyribosyltransferase domain-containing protein n=1 Tax=Streptomyces xanthophaeus TaxID=67385 RepID=UPI00343E4B3B